MVNMYDDFEKACPAPKLYRPPLAVQFNPSAWATAYMTYMAGPYAYALNLPQIGECKPGHLLTPPMVEDMLSNNERRAAETPEELAAKLHSDGLFYHDTLPRHGHVMAFFSKPGTRSKPSELLYVRRDSNNLWSFREITGEGGCRRPYLPRQCDFSGNPIRDVLKADFGRFGFIGFASIPYEGVLYYRRCVPPATDMRPFHRIVPAEVSLSRR